MRSEEFTMAPTYRLAHHRSSAVPWLATVLGLCTLGCGESEESTDENFTRIVYAVRQHTIIGEDGVTIDVAGGMGQVMDYGRYHPGGRLEIYNLKTGAIDNIVEDHPGADIASVDVSFDATKVVFSMKTSIDDNYHLYWAGLERGSDGKFEIHKLTFVPFDDQHAIWVAGDRIAFITNQPYTEMGTRADEYNHAREVTQIATVTLAGGDADRKLCSQNLSHTINLFSMADGRIGFSRWEHLENVNDVKLFAMYPDCTSMVAVSGQHGKPVGIDAETANSLVQVSETATPNVFLAIATDREETVQAGALVQIDARASGDSRRFDEERSQYTVLTPSVPVGNGPSPVGRYRSPAPLPDGRILVSWADGLVNARNELYLTPPNYGVYLYDPKDPERNNKLILNHDGSWELYARPVAARRTPPIISSIQNTTDATVASLFGSIDIKQTSLGRLHDDTVSGAQFNDTPTFEALAQAKKVRIIEGFSSEASPGTTMFGLTMAEGAAILGEATVYADGSWLAEIPPYLPVHLQPIDEFELAIRNQTTWIQGMPGEDRVCGGCHEERTGVNLPGRQNLTTAAGNGAQNFLLPIKDRIEYPWSYAKPGYEGNQIQALFDAKCVSCHNETTNGNVAQQYYEVTMTNELTGAQETFPIPRMDLSSRPLMVTYDNETKEWPASYVSIFYPAAFEMEMDGATLVGTLPPQWGIPSDARNSVLVEKLNMTSSIDPTRYAWPLGEPFSDASVQGSTRTDHGAAVNLTREERTMLIRAIDMGGQFYARQNSDFQPFANDPVAATGGTQY
jgi:hypothetical protein